MELFHESFVCDTCVFICVHVHMYTHKCECWKLTLYVFIHSLLNFL